MNLPTPVMDGTAPPWAHAYARTMETLIRSLLKRIADLEARLTELEAP